MRRQTAIAVLGATLLSPFGALAQNNVDSDNWTFSIAPYLWLPSVGGTLNYGPPRTGGGSANVSVDAATLLGDLNMAAMVAGSARNGRWLIASDLMYLDLSGGDSKIRSVDLNPGSGPINVSTSSINAGVDVKLKGVIWTVIGGYAIVQEPRANLDLIGGFRYLGLDTTTDWNLTAAVTATGPNGSTATFARTGSVSDKENIWAGIVGAKGRFNLGESNWFANYYVDVGGGSSVTTWQGIAGVGYAYKWGEIVLDYRYLDYSQSGNQLIESINFGGPALGANFRF